MSDEVALFADREVDAADAGGKMVVRIPVFISVRSPLKMAFVLVDNKPLFSWSC